MTSDPWNAAAAAQFVLLGTVKRSGEEVRVPVWIAPDGDELVVTSERSTGKVKRLRNDPRVTLTPCSRMGKPEPGAVTVEARGVIAGLAESEPSANRALARKYGWQFRAITGFERFVRRIQRRDGQRVILRIRRAD
jgi:PPOX class probable F420-dependent enzyme